MHVPSADELAAIAAAYVAVTAPAGVTARNGARASAETSRWSLSGRLPACDDRAVRFAAGAASRWNAAGRLDG
jgi:hypothetical protein